MAATLTLRVITPESVALDEQVQSVRLPGLDGSLGILPRHAHMIAGLETGILLYTDASGRRKPLFVNGGFAEVQGGTVRVITRAGELAEEIDEERARAAEKRARERLDAVRRDNLSDADVLKAELAMRRAIMRLRARSYLD
ncbi:ATP synthase epsilon chain [Planctomycetes bacterium Pla163]|uniref:ATP synthase epsilon chain n=1 Tax=Rohdeia mirabilis TaxID=2528008 RepID=A0A518D056_9BACT|nr:ATP synthase epsilon chain [Planctomycetes bacterium Pla163]